MSIIDSAMLDLSNVNISYEDGLRLSELEGHLASCQYQLAHFWSIDGIWLILLAILACLFFGALTYGIVCKKDNSNEKFAIAVGVIVGLLFLILVIWGGSIIWIQTINQDVASTTAQIDTILAQYGISL